MLVICLPAGSSDAKDIAILENHIVCLRESIVNDRPPSLLYQLLKFIQGKPIRLTEVSVEWRKEAVVSSFMTRLFGSVYILAQSELVRLSHEVHRNMTKGSTP